MSQEEDQGWSSASASSDSQADSALAGMTSQPQDQQSMRRRIQEELSRLGADLTDALKETASTTIATVKEKPDEVIIMSALFLHTAHEISSSGPGAGLRSSLDLRLGPTLAATLSQQFESLRMGGARNSATVGEETSGLGRSETIDWLVSHPSYTLLATIFADQGVGGSFPAITAAVWFALGSNTVSLVRSLFPSVDLNFWSSIAKRYEETKKHSALFFSSVDLDYWSPIAKRYEETKKYFAQAEALSRKTNPRLASKADIRKTMKERQTESGSGASPVADTVTSLETRSDGNDSVASGSAPPNTQGAQRAQTSKNRRGNRRKQPTPPSSAH